MNQTPRPISNTPWLEHLLTARLSLLLTQAQRHPATGSVAQTIVPTDRLIWIKKGTLNYQTENVTTQLTAGDFWLVPAWTRRAWQVSSKAGCSMAWVEFVVHNEAGALAKPVMNPATKPAMNSATYPTPLARVSKASSPLTQAMNLLMVLADTPGHDNRLLAELQLKWLLGLVVHQSSQTQEKTPQAAAPKAASGANDVKNYATQNAVSNASSSASQNAVHHTAQNTHTSARPVSTDHGLSELLEFIHQHLHEADLLTQLPDRVSLSPSRLRSRFVKALGQSPGRYLQTMRMHRARYLLLTTDLSVKQIAVRTGYDDPLYFSRRYRTFWGRPATMDRAPSP